MRRLGRVLALAACLALTGCSAGDRVVDTWPIGDPSDCPAPSPRCEELTRVGLAGFDSRDPGHLAIVSARLHAEGGFMNPKTGGTILMKRSGGCCQVLVVELADNSTHAIGVGYPGISDVAIAVPWEIPPP